MRIPIGYRIFSSLAQQEKNLDAQRALSVTAAPTTVDKRREHEVQLSRTLTLRDLTMLIVGTVIGSGIFLVPGKVLFEVNGRVGFALLVWVVGGVMSLLGALTYGELSAANPKAGGLYVYIRDGFGPIPAFLYGWALFFVICSGSVATLAVAFGSYLAQLFPLTPAVSKAVAVGMIAVVAAVNVSGTRRSANLQNWTTAVKALALIAMSVVLLKYGTWPKNNEMATALHPRPLFQGFFVAMVGVLWAYEGWQYCTFSAGETKNPRRDFPRAFLLALLALVGIYLLANLGYLAALGAVQAAHSDRIAAEAIAKVLGLGASRLIALAILISIFSASNGLTLTGTRVFYAMANDGLFFRRMATIHPRFGTPAFAVVAGSVWAALLALTGTFDQLLTYVVFIGWIFYILGAASIFYYRSVPAYSDRPYSVPGYPWTPILFVLSAASVVINTVLATPQRALVGFGIVLLGLPAYALWARRRGRSPLIKREGTQP